MRLRSPGLVGGHRAGSSLGEADAGEVRRLVIDMATSNPTWGLGQPAGGD